MIDPELQNLPPEKALELIKRCEQEADRLLAENKISEWQAWEIYFALMYECNLRAIDPEYKEYENELWIIRDRVIGKIDRERFNPLLSKNPAIILIVRDIAARKNIPLKFDN